MNFSCLKHTTLRPQKEKYLSTFVIALITAAALFVPYMIMSEGYFTFYGDFNVQMIPFYKEAHKAIKSGNIFWNWNTDLGADFIGSYSYYLIGSPFFWLTIPFPNWMVPYLMGPLLILKFACAAFTSYCYIWRFTRTPQAARLGGLLYAFSGFSVYNIFFNMFHEPIIVFPLLLLALELLITENRRFVFALAVALCAITNYFFFFGMVVFTVIYFFVRLFSGAISVKVSRFFVIAFEAVLGLALAAFLLMPSILAILGNTRISNVLLGWNAVMYGKEQIYANILECFFFPPDIPARPVFFPGADVKWSSLGGWLPLFSMVGVFVWFSQRKNHWLKRVLGISIFMAMVPILNSAFYAFNTAYYARWFYMPILMMCLATVSLTEDSTVNWSMGYKWVLGITLAVTLVIGLFPQKNSEDDSLIFGLYTQSDDGTYAFRFWVTCAIAIFSLVILGMLLRLIKSDRSGFYKGATVCVCIISIVYGNFFIACGRSHSYDIKNIMIDQLIEGEVDLEDDSNFRVDVYDGVDNTSMYLDLPGINAFHSVVPASIMEFYDYIGVERDVASRPDTDLAAIRPLLSVKYLLNRKNGESFLDDNNETLMPDYEYIKTSGGYYIYENKNYIPYGFSYNYYMSYDFCDSYSKSKRASLMLKAILLTDEQIQKYGYLLDNLENLELPPYDYEDYGTTLSLTDEAMAYDCEALRETSADSFEIDNRGFTAKVTREKDNLVFFSVPYDEGWTAYVNGKEAEIEKVNAGFMAVKVGAGTSEIRFTYTTPGLVNGLLITGSACLVLLIYILIWSIYNKRHSPDNHYPEGELLIKEWRKQDREDALKILSERFPETPKESILDDNPDINIPHIENGFDGGFKIDSDMLDEDR
ncbi:MAG: YfhO family protein [Acutalibacteraceae bacterium]|nr:YfhO family protein [Acutalibacteraceae bacterium]